jgi:hypothetical protein
MNKPERTAIDWIVEADQIITARPARDNAFMFEPIAILAGDSNGIDIPYIVDSTTRRKLENNPGVSVIFARVADEPWQRVGLMDDVLGPIFRTALERRSAWEIGNDSDRLTMIEDLQNHPDPRVQALVISEFDRLPYHILRDAEITIPAEQLLSDLWTRQGYPFQAIRVLLLGLHGNDAARAEITSYIDRVADWDWAQNLGAFAAAWIEIDGVEAVEGLGELMLRDPGQPLDKLEQVVTALSVHNSVADAQVRHAISAEIAEFIALRPEAAGIVARQFTARADWSQAAILAPLVQDRRLHSAADLLTVSIYLAQARQAELSTGSEG